MKLHPLDNALVVLQDLKRGELIEFQSHEYLIGSDIPSKHKFAAVDFTIGSTIIMYGLIVGKAIIPIKKGEAITTQNVKHEASSFVVRPATYEWHKPDVSRWNTVTFQGYHRKDGKVGTRNYWVVLPLVFCENRNITYIKNAFVRRLGYDAPDKYESLVNTLVQLYQNDPYTVQSVKFEAIAKKKLAPVFSNVDGIRFLTHEGGCGGTREDARNLTKLFAGYINNPNVAGATVLSLGCQNAEISLLQEALVKANPAFDKPVLYFEQQQYPSEEKLLHEAIHQTFSGLIEANKNMRQPASLSKLIVGLKCGGSDGFSGITANPAMGYVSDLLATIGGTTILAEFPELCGAEQDLIDRCVNTNIASKFSSLITNYSNKADAVGSGFSMNPSPGNIKDGLITDAMKSAGAARKGGLSPVTDVLNYTEFVSRPGLNLLCTPGNDVEATTGMAGSGANLIIFSTGLGTPTGNAITPVLKTSTNSILPARMKDIIDFDHGDIITHGKTIEESGAELLENLIQVASGQLTRAELLQQHDFIPWKKGVSL